MTKDQLIAANAALLLANAELTNKLALTEQCVTDTSTLATAEIEDLTYELAHKTNDCIDAGMWRDLFRKQRDNARAALTAATPVATKAASAKAEITSDMTLEQRRAAMTAAKAAAIAR